MIFFVLHPSVVITRFIRVIQLFTQLAYRDKPGNDTHSLTGRNVVVEAH